MDARRVEKIAKGFANHWRVDILVLLEKKPNLSLFNVTDELNANFKTISEHLRRLTGAGLVMKRNRGARVEHSLTDLGRKALKFLRTLE
jgi:DNA-binding HxlR family transcriptional regulator